MTYQDYLDAIVRYYESGVSEGKWKELNRPTPGKIKRLCLSRIKSGLKKNDEEFLNDFFEDRVITDYARKVRNELDKFKPLANFLTEKTGKPTDKTLEFLGWLIEFPQRPYKRELNYSGLYQLQENASRKGKSKIASSGTALIEENRNTIIPESKEPEENRRRVFAFLPRLPKRKSIAAGLLFATLGSGAYFTQQAIGGKNAASGQCMYWTGTKYELTSCEPKGGDTLVIAADYDKLEKFELITRKDTLSRWAIGRVWYLKRNNQIEYFTAGGTHPLYPEKTLKKLSLYMYDKYIQPKKENPIAGK